MAGLTDLKRTAADKKAERKRWEEPVMASDDYPYGLSIHLDHETLAKLGVDLDAEDEVTITGQCVVTESSVNTNNGVTTKRAVLQIRKMKIAGAREPNASKELYED